MEVDRWQHMAELFQEALQHEREERYSFLREACGDDPEMLRAVESLLQADSEAADFLEENPGAYLRSMSSGYEPH